MAGHVEDALAQPLKSSLSGLVAAAMSAVAGWLRGGPERWWGLGLATIILSAVVALLIFAALRAAEARRQVAIADAIEAVARQRGDIAYCHETREMFVEQAWLAAQPPPLIGDRLLDALLQNVADRFQDAFGITVGIVVVREAGTELAIQTTAGRIHASITSGQSCPHDEAFDRIVRRYADEPYVIPFSFGSHRYRFVILCDEELRVEEMRLAQDAALWYQMLAMRTRPSAPPNRMIARFGPGTWRREDDS